MRSVVTISGERAAAQSKARLCPYVIDQPHLPDHSAGTNSRTILTINNINTCGEENTMSLKIRPREADGVMILDLTGRVTTGEPSVTVRDAVRKEIDKGFKNMLLNMGDITYIDSAGLGELIAAYTTVKNRGGHLKLLNLTKRLHELMQITKLYTVFDVYDDEAKALGSF
jgi:anti-sigma B factor antagonist